MFYNRLAAARLSAGIPMAHSLRIWELRKRNELAAGAKHALGAWLGWIIADLAGHDPAGFRLSHKFWAESLLRPPGDASAGSFGAVPERLAVAARLWQ